MSLPEAHTEDKAKPGEAERLIHQEFAALRACYLDVAARGPLPASAQAAVAAMLAAQAEGRVPKADWLALAERVRGRLAAWLGAEADEIAFTQNVSDGLNRVATALNLGPGDRIIAAPVIEHPNNVFPWLWQAARNGAEFAEVHPRPGQPLEEALIAALDGRTRLLAISSVDFATGRRTDLAALGAACRSRDVFLLVDGAQSAGVLAEDFSKLPVDGWATATQKGLLGLYGLGVLFVRRAWADRLRPAGLARFSVTLQAEHEAAGPEAGWTLRAGAGRFETGNYNYPALAAQEASLELLGKLGPAEVERRAVGAAAALRSGLEALDIPLLQVPMAHRSHILAVAAAQGEGHDTAETPWVGSLSACLRAAGIGHSVRRGAVRLSTHMHVLPDGVAEVLDCAAAWRRQQDTKLG
ncbi:MAG: aminotransferase class V-fold PLP-dependent enzyme [Rubritepida sp.]|nr:aminotransferase class V-fold PLP-dependent enzyme [Rubritepida sp.]